MSSDEVEGFQVVVQALKHHGIEYMFGVVGIPIVEVAIAAQQVWGLNIKYVIKSYHLKK